MGCAYGRLGRRDVDPGLIFAERRAAFKGRHTPRPARRDSKCRTGWEVRHLLATHFAPRSELLVLGPGQLSRFTNRQTVRGYYSRWVRRICDLRSCSSTARVQVWSVGGVTIVNSAFNKASGMTSYTPPRQRGEGVNRIAARLNLNKERRIAAHGLTAGDSRQFHEHGSKFRGIILATAVEPFGN